MSRWVGIALAVAAIAPAQAGQAPHSPLTDLFANTCMAHFHRSAGLFEQMKAAGAGVLAGEAAAFFLTQLPGVAWGVSIADASFVVAQRDDGVCAVFARDADVTQVEQAFQALVADAPAPMLATAMPGEKFGPNEAPLKTVAYGWGAGDKPPTLAFVLTTSREDVAAVRAMISLSAHQALTDLARPKGAD